MWSQRPNTHGLAKIKWKDAEFNTDNIAVLKKVRKGNYSFLNAAITTETKHSILELHFLECCKNKSVSLNPINPNNSDHLKMLSEKTENSKYPEL